MEVDIPPRLIEGCAAALAELANEYQLAIVSDAIVTPGRGLRKILENHDVLKHFQAFAFSDEVGHSKPHFDMFATVAQQLNVDLNQVVHIGDRDHNDVQGAHQHGMRAILFTASRDVDRNRSDPDAHCDNYCDLPRTIAQLAKGLCMKPLRFLVIDGYTKQARDQLQSGGASVAADLYVAMLKKCTPWPVETEIVFPSDPNVSLPQDAELKSFDGVAWTGCSLCLNDNIPEVERQVQFAKHAFEVGVPSFGSCWAAQIAIVAAGGKVAVNPKGREMGIARKIQLTREGRSHPLYEGKSAVFDAFISHDDEITHLPPGAVCLATNSWTRVQAVAVTHCGTSFWGLQYHPEYDLHEMARLTYCRIEKLIRYGFFRGEQDAHEYVDRLEALHGDPSRKDIAWQLGIDADVMNEDVRLMEVRNWISRLVLPGRLADC